MIYINIYVLLDIQSVCSHSSVWSLVCYITVSVCESPPDVPHTHLAYSTVHSESSSEEKLVEGRYVYYQCDDGYTMVNSKLSLLICHKGEWIGTLPSCGMYNVKLEIGHRFTVNPWY